MRRLRVSLNPDVPLKLEDIIRKALEKDRDVRYQHASDIKADIKRLRRDTESGKTSSMVTAKPRLSRRALLISVTVLSLGIALATAGVFYFGNRRGAQIDSVAVRLFQCQWRPE
jgi:serine/threonine protein kinase